MVPGSDLDPQVQWWHNFRKPPPMTAIETAEVWIYLLAAWIVANWMWRDL